MLENRERVDLNVFNKQSLYERVKTFLTLTLSKGEVVSEMSP